MERLGDDWIRSIRHTLLVFTAAELKDELERVLITGVMASNNFNQTQSAKALDMSRGAFRKKLIKHGLIIINKDKGQVMNEWDNVKEFKSEETTVRKFVFTKEDAVVESVLYAYPSYEERTVICCSVQSGCPVGCTFCGTGKYFVRNLTVDEILSQVKYSLDQSGIDPHKIKNLQIMFMSMGEPMLNPKSMKVVLPKLSQLYPDAKLLISTSAPRVNYSWLAEMSAVIPNIGLQFSVHESTDENRNKLVPFKEKLSLSQIAEEGLKWNFLTGRKPFFNYCTHKGNSGRIDAQNLRDLFHPSIFEATISVICESDNGIQRDTEAHIMANKFANMLVEYGFNTRVFDPAGQDDIGGGCGQLWFVQDWMKENPKLAKRSSGYQVIARSNQ